VSAAADTTVLAVGAHPDDLEATCGGTLALLARRGASVHLAVVTAGECGSYDLHAAEAARVRLREAARAAEIAGAASFHHLGMRDQGGEATIERRRELVDLIRRLRANLLIGHAPGDYHSDHRAAHRLVTDARMAAAVPNFGNEPPLPATPDLVYMDNAWMLGFDPHLWIDISETIDVRREMLAAHQSQVELMRRMYGEDLLAGADLQAQARGGQRGCAYAEVFRGCGTWPAPDGGIRRLVRLLE
jgi:LmbE family N-acetylglucosaminyl deacetylase